MRTPDADRVTGRQEWVDERIAADPVLSPGGSALQGLASCHLLVVGAVAVLSLIYGDWLVGAVATVVFLADPFSTGVPSAVGGPYGDGGVVAMAPEVMGSSRVPSGATEAGPGPDSGAAESVMREVFARYFRGDREGAAALFAPDALFQYPAPGPLHGDYHGRDGVRAFWAAQDRFAGQVFRPRLLDLAATQETVFLLVEAGDQEHCWQRVVVYEVADGAVRVATVFEGDPVQAQAYFTSAGQDHAADAAREAP